MTNLGPALPDQKTSILCFERSIRACAKGYSATQPLKVRDRVQKPPYKELDSRRGNIFLTITLPEVESF